MICVQSRGGQGGWGQGLLQSSSCLLSPLRDSAGVDRKTLWKKRRRGRERSEEEGRRESVGGGGGSEEGGLFNKREAGKSRQPIPRSVRMSDSNCCRRLLTSY